MLATSRQGQTLIDIAMQYAGTPDAIVSLMLANALSATTVLEVGSKVVIPFVQNELNKRYYQDNKISPSSACMHAEAVDGGIGVWGISIDFIIE